MLQPSSLAVLALTVIILVSVWVYLAFRRDLSASRNVCEVPVASSTPLAGQLNTRKSEVAFPC